MQRSAGNGRTQGGAVLCLNFVSTHAESENRKGQCFGDDGSVKRIVRTYAGEDLLFSDFFRYGKPIPIDDPERKKPLKAQIYQGLRRSLKFSNYPKPRLGKPSVFLVVGFSPNGFNQKCPYESKLSTVIFA